jgi:hypothetical protein
VPQNTLRGGVYQLHLNMHKELQYYYYYYYYRMWFHYLINKYSLFVEKIYFILYFFLTFHYLAHVIL